MELKTKLLEVMKHGDFNLTDLAILFVGEITEVCEVVNNQQNDLMRAMSVELEQRDEIKRLEKQVLELDVGNQKNIKSIENWMDIASNLNKLVKESYWESMWKDRE